MRNSRCNVAKDGTKFLELSVFFKKSIVCIISVMEIIG